MTVYVDNLLPYRMDSKANISEWCHMTADTRAELHAFAASIGLKRAWFQDKPNGRWHYDLTRKKRTQAIIAGAQAIDSATFIAVVRSRP